ncbi:MAG: RagB/SusD family nutrient uptake outer membrane protein [Dysgonamonadaceae bacterium]|jgi:hypothetical protein|nr:RagB/SusD family nutrient uptake outer membrane protein [Dysgonamonadaceae bacterium]
MNTNIYKILFVLLFGLSVLSSCNDDFMERAPENAISDASVWKTSSDLELYVNNFYNKSDLLLIDNAVGASANVGIYTLDRDNGADTQVSRAFNSRMNGQGSIPSSGGGWAISDWETLRNINYFFANYHKATGDEAAINRYVGEALFFRSIFYFNKIRLFGDVPWYGHLLNPDDEDLYKGRDPRNVVVDSLIADLDKAINYLPSRGTGATWNGRLNKETAMLLQARIALFEGTWEKYHAGTPFGVTGSDGSKLITKAKEITDALIASGACDLDNKGLENGYQNVFNKESYKGSKEVLFWRQYNKSLNLGNGWSDFSTYGALSGLSQRMVDTYLCNDGSPIEGNSLYKGDNTLLNVVDNRDPRLSQTLFVNDGEHIQFAGNVPFKYPNFESSDRGCITGYQVYKGHIPNEELSGASGQQAMIYFRYAEALLINAEAKAESGSITQEDIDRTINQLRRRLVGMADMSLAGVNALPASARIFPNLSNIINEIRRERTVELAVEGFRVDDIFRWAAADVLIKGYVPQGAKRVQWEGSLPDAPNGFTAAVNALRVDDQGYITPYAAQAFPATGYNFNTSRDYLRALPTNQLVLNPNLTQNPGW